MSNDLLDLTQVDGKLVELPDAASRRPTASADGGGSSTLDSDRHAPPKKKTKHTLQEDHPMTARDAAPKLMSARSHLLTPRRLQAHVDSVAELEMKQRGAY